MTPFRLGPWSVDPASRELVCDDRTTRISPKAMGVLLALKAADQRVMSRADLLDTVWPDVTVGEEVLTHAIAELRKALCENAKSPRLIETVHKTGYRLLAAARPLSQPAEAENEITGPLGGLRRRLHLEAYGECLRGRMCFERGGADNMRTAVEAYGAASRLDPDSVSIKAEFAETLAFTYLYYNKDERYLEHAVNTAETAVRSAPEFAAGHAALGFAQSIQSRHRLAASSFTKAIRLQPEGFWPHYLLGRYLFAEGDMKTSAPLLERAADINQNDFHGLVIAAKAYRETGDAVSAERVVRTALARIDLHMQANPNDARAKCGKAFCLVELGDTDEGLRIASAAAPSPDPLLYYYVGAFARAGELSCALEALEASLDGGWAHGAWLQSDPDLTLLRDESRFKRMANALGCN